MDTLIVTPCFLLILEVKNLKGDLNFDLIHNQLFRELEGVRDIFPDPFLQVEHQKLQLSHWLDNYNCIQMPIHSFVVIANPNTSFKTTEKNSFDWSTCIVRSKGIIPAVHKLYSSYSDRGVLTKQQTHELAALFEKENSPFSRSLVEKYEITMDQLILGVQCEKCRVFGMERKRDHWKCGRCEWKSKDAHKQTLRDYHTLFGSEITNIDFRKFAGLKSVKVARKLLKEVCSHNSGHTQSRKYYIKL